MKIKWYRNGALVDSITGNNTGTFSSIKQSDAGIWTVKVTNPGAPLLTLQSRQITINVQSSCRLRDSIALIDF
ncbi:MAG: hypothetical protein IPO26_20010, partial [Saprospiraceae bacterium]|nr:hypothetical protein [Saprospiraceae bacterium]